VSTHASTDGDERPLISLLGAETHEWPSEMVSDGTSGPRGTVYSVTCRPYRPQGRTPERVARDLGVWYALGGWAIRHWRVLLVVASYCAAAALGWWLRGLA